ncbi:MAG: NAD-dependent epimerase/dehydratase family protein [Magnetovibrionaceae bacterium]
MADLGDGLIPVLVTGAGGFLGAEVCAALQSKGQEVLAVHHRAARGGIALDLLDQPSVLSAVSDLGIETVVHCAAMVPKAAAGYSDEAMAAGSIDMVRNLLGTPIKRMVFASSMTVYGPEDDMPVKEESARGDALSSPYARGKWQAEKLILDHEGTRSTIIRLPGLFGFPRRSGLIYNVAKAFLAKEEPPVSGPFPLWGALHVGDAAEVMADLVLSSDASDGIFNVGYEGAQSIPEAVALLAGMTGARAPDLGPAPRFEMDLEKLKAALNPAFLGAFPDRLRQTVEAIKAEQASG